MYYIKKYEEIKTAIESIMELPADWLQRNYMECVDARTLLVATMVQHHCTRREIMHATGLKKATVAKLARQYCERMKFDKRFQMLDNWLHAELAKDSTRSVY